MSVLLDSQSAPKVKRAFRSAGDPSSEDLRSAKTIGAHEAVRYLADLRREEEIKGATTILAARNASVHSALPPVIDQLGYALGRFLRHVFSVADERGDFLGKAAHAAMEKRYSELQDTLRHKKEGANKFYERLTAGKSDDDRARMIHAREQNPTQLRKDLLGTISPVTCPVCGSDADFLEEVVSVDWEYERSGEPASRYPVFEHELECSVCELALTDAEISALSDELDFPDGSILATVVDTLPEADG